MLGAKHILTDVAAAGCVNDNVSKDPQDGDVRLVPLTGVDAVACGAVHAGGVEMFHNGQWGRICTTSRSTSYRSLLTASPLVVSVRSWALSDSVNVGP